MPRVPVLIAKLICEFIINASFLYIIVVVKQKKKKDCVFF